MPGTPTRRLRLPIPSGGDPADGPDAVGDLANALDASILGYAQGTLAARPAFGTEGRMYYATDIGSLYYDTGTGWVISGYQPGDLRLTARSGDPVGWLVCDGSAVSRSTFAALFAAIGTTWGAGDGSTTFNVPDFRGRVPVGAGTGSGLSPRTVGQRGGEEAHRLTVDEMPRHDHQYRKLIPVGSGGIVAGGSTYLEISGAYTDDNGGDGAHNNMQPFAVVNMWIKT